MQLRLCLLLPGSLKGAVAMSNAVADQLVVYLLARFTARKRNA